MGISSADQELFYNQEYPNFMAIPDDQTIVLTIPQEEAVAEAQRMVVVTSQYEKELLDSDVDQKFIDSLPARVGAFIMSVVLCQTVLKSSETGSEIKSKLKDEAVELRKTLGKDFRRAFRNRPDLLKMVDNIMDGKSDHDLSIDMLSLSKLGKANPDLLAKIKSFKAEKLDRAAQLHVDLSDSMAQAKVDPKTEEETTKVCNKAWTHLKEALDEIYDGGRYAFPEEDERHFLFYNDYYRRLGALAAKQRNASEKAEASAQKPTTPVEKEVEKPETVGA